jgi:hypothetical protein
MDILHLIDRLEDLVDSGYDLPFTSNVILHKDEVLDIIDQMRVSIPEEVKLAKRTEADRERLLLQAQEEATRIVDMAREKAQAMTEEHELVEFARERAVEIEADAHQHAEDILAETDEYIVDQLSELEEQLMKTLTTVRNGLRLVRETHQQHEQAKQVADEPEAEPKDQVEA